MNVVITLAKHYCQVKCLSLEYGLGLSLLMLSLSQALKSEGNDSSKEVLLNKSLFVWNFYVWNLTQPVDKCNGITRSLIFCQSKRTLSSPTGLLSREALNKRKKTNFLTRKEEKGEKTEWTKTVNKRINNQIAAIGSLWMWFLGYK